MQTTLGATRDRPTETDLKVFPELPLRGEYRLVGAVVQKHERDERDHDLKYMASNHRGVIHTTFAQNTDDAHLHEEVDPYEVDPDVVIVLPESSRLQDSPAE